MCFGDPLRRLLERSVVVLDEVMGDADQIRYLPEDLSGKYHVSAILFGGHSITYRLWAKCPAGTRLPAVTLRACLLPPPRRIDEGGHFRGPLARSERGREQFRRVADRLHDRRGFGRRVVVASLARTLAQTGQCVDALGDTSGGEADESVPSLFEHQLF